MLIENFKYTKYILSNTLEAISLKLEKNLLNEIDQKITKHRYSTRTEFIRDAIREKLSELEKQELLNAVSKLRGISKRKTTDEQLHEARERLVKKYENKFK